MPTRLLLVRHGQSIWNAEGRWQGSADPPLSPEGETQARHAGARLGELGIRAVTSSQLRRARRTAELAAAAADLDVLAPSEALAERCAGEWEGLTRAEIEQGYPGWLAEGRRPPGYESDESILLRAAGGLGALAATHPGETLAVVTHGGVIGALERAAGSASERIANLEARWFVMSGGVPRVDGDRVHLLVAAEETEAPSPGYA